MLQQLSEENNTDQQDWEEDDERSGNCTESTDCNIEEVLAINKTSLADLVAEEGFAYDKTPHAFELVAANTLAELQPAKLEAVAEAVHEEPAQLAQADLTLAGSGDGGGDDGSAGKPDVFHVVNSNESPAIVDPSNSLYGDLLRAAEGDGDVDCAELFRMLTDQDSELCASDKHGSTYEGQSVNGKRHGKGVWRSGLMRYEGQWLNDQKHGDGRLTWDDGRVYQGCFEEDRFHGDGRMEWSTAGGSTLYEGQYVNDVKHGIGKYTWPDGRIYDGEWMNGGRSGEATYINKVGAKRQGVWKNDKFERWLGPAVSGSAVPASIVFTVVVSKNDMRFGIDVDLSSGSTILIERIIAGAVNNYNSITPGEKITPGDHIVSVNGVTGNAQRMIDALSTSEEVRMMIQRPQAVCRLTDTSSEVSSSCGDHDPFASPVQGSDVARSVGTFRDTGAACGFRKELWPTAPHGSEGQAADTVGWARNGFASLKGRGLSTPQASKNLGVAVGQMATAAAAARTTLVSRFGVVGIVRPPTTVPTAPVPH